MSNANPEISWSVFLLEIAVIITDTHMHIYTSLKVLLQFSAVSAYSIGFKKCNKPIKCSHHALALPDGVCLNEASLYQIEEANGVTYPMSGMG